MSTVSLYSRLLQKAAASYNAARCGDEKALAVETVAFGLEDQWETFKVLTYDELQDDSKTTPIAEFMADGLGFKLSDLI